MLASWINIAYNGIWLKLRSLLLDLHICICRPADVAETMIRFLNSSLKLKSLLDLHIPTREGLMHLAEAEVLPH
jgi:hypothetical protein